MMESILFTYDKQLSRKNGQFTVVLTPAIYDRGRWEIFRRPKAYYVKDLISAATRAPDKALLRTAIESEMAFRKSEARLVSHEQEFTRLRIASRHLNMFITACRKRRLLIHPDGSPAMFRMDKGVIPEISVEQDRLVIYLGNLPLAEADIVVKTTPVTMIREDRIVQLHRNIPFSFLKAIPIHSALAQTERDCLLAALSKQPDKVRIRSIGEKEIRTVSDATAQATLSFDERAARARLYFVYEGNRVKDNDDIAVVVDLHRHKEIHRNTSAEQSFKAVLLSHGFCPHPDRDFNWRVPEQPLESLVPSLENHGFAVNIGNRKIVAPVSVRWKVQTQRQHLRVGATVFSGDERLGLDQLFQAFSEGKRYVTRPDGALGIISGEIRRVLEQLSEYGIMDQGIFTFDKADFPAVRNCLSGEEEVRSDAAFDALCRFGAQMDGVRRYPIPAGLETVLRPYQILGFNWMRTLHALGLNGILADDMGLGKSVQVLALIKSLKEEGVLAHPVLLITPKTLIFNWELEIRKFAPDLQTYSFCGPSRIRKSEFLEKHDIILTSYGLLRTETPLLCTHKWAYVIIDEAQAIKNATAMTSRAVKHLTAGSRLAITGTPVENSAADLWSQFDFLMPGFLGDLTAFKENYADTAKDLERLREKTKPYILRRLKSQVLAELPPKTEVTIYCDFAEEQKAIYDQALAAARDQMETIQGSRPFHILRLILRLRQIACHPRLAVKEGRKALGSGKTGEVFHTAVEILSEGHKILVFSQFTRHLQLIRELFLRHEIPSYYLDGRTSDRAAVVHAFKSHAGPCLFFISLKAGGTGLNLNEASYVFLLDPWWNPAVENQAVDRCHRLGQQQPVTVYRFITRDSIEEKVADLKAAKKEIEDALIDASAPQYVPFDEKTLARLVME